MLVAAPRARHRFAAARPLAVPQPAPRAAQRVWPRSRSAALGWGVLLVCATLNLALYGAGLLSASPEPVPLADSDEKTFRETLLTRPSTRLRRQTECQSFDIGYGLVDPCVY